jgi:hypothetical protein
LTLSVLALGGATVVVEEALLADVDTTALLIVALLRAALPTHEAGLPVCGAGLHALAVLAGTRAAVTVGVAALPVHGAAAHRAGAVYTGLRTTLEIGEALLSISRAVAALLASAVVAIVRATIVIGKAPLAVHRAAAAGQTEIAQALP